MKALSVFTIFMMGMVTIDSAVADDFNKGGRTTMQFTKIGLGARQVGMGESNITINGNAGNLFWNPAGLGRIDKASSSFTYVRWIGDMNYLAASVAMRVMQNNIVGLSLTSLSYGDIPEAVVSASGTSDARTGNSFSGSDLLVGGTLAREFTDRLTVAVTAKHLREELFDYVGTVTAFDIGSIYSTGFKGIRIGMSAQNFGTSSVSFLEESDREDGYDIPLMYRVGFSGNVMGESNAFITASDSHLLTVAFTAVNSNDYGERYNLGLEYWYNQMIAARVGYRSNYSEGNLAMGFGFMGPIGSSAWAIDYAFVFYENLNTPHRLTISTNF
ncbi:MAG: PorV/PorQ family protein [Candidatus Marinimicrobia bacterium]|nr:PorV/PorQ family protein [Candidatus Neomarinimicrobiota bacterium]MCF7850917.1 PorV/PorQ family protein [Candidatus Neomarinimicrobiota bacterium]MCF7905315.1 PorV/PorQ family protein [Candidatus Neomarinimicrobiota bacterium]